MKWAQAKQKCQSEHRITHVQKITSSQIWEVNLSARLQLPERSEEGKSKCPTPRGNNMSSKKSRKGRGTYGSWKIHQGLSSATHIKSVKLCHPTESMKGLYSSQCSWHRINRCKLSGSSCDNWPAVCCTKPAGKGPNLQVRTQMSRPASSGNLLLLLLLLLLSRISRVWLCVTP